MPLYHYLAPSDLRFHQCSLERQSAGKTTLTNSLDGVHLLTAGQARLHGSLAGEKYGLDARRLVACYFLDESPVRIAARVKT